ncbi:MAG TPA: hypothetical protein PLQ03_08930 [Brevundimonas sp.]|uniref:hypothetical protein n=1 Tax=Brevundimonas sp. TaxID=1871086 RepID=UPI00262F1BAF|nr:hypothetical protein [Brevundimonas sp.]HRO33518.1 hypothetical protein [Brevundimonas sp.]
MRPNAAQIILALAAAIAFVLAFMAAGAVLVSSLFLLAGLCALGFLAFSLIRRVLFRGRLAAARRERGAA